MTRSTLHLEAQWERPALTLRERSATLMIRIIAPSIAASAATRPRVDLAFVLDRSGSMAGQPIELAKRAVSQAVGMLDQHDRAAVVVFDDRVELLHGLSEMNHKQRSELRSALARVDAGASTDLCAGWLSGCRELARHERAAEPGHVRRAILLTDGNANHGETSASVICQHATELRRRGICTTALGMGYNFDEGLLSAMTEAGGGNFAYIESPTQLARTFERELDRLTAVTATHLNVRLRLPEGLFGELLSPFPVERKGRQFDVAVDDLSADDEIALVFEIRGCNLRTGTSLPVQVSARWTDALRNDVRTNEAEISPIAVVEESVFEATPSSDEVAVQAAKLGAMRDQRQAMELDRAGRYAESRRILRKAADDLLAAPDAEEMLTLRSEAEAYAAHDAAAPLSEHTRKQAVHNSLYRTRRRQQMEERP